MIFRIAKRIREELARSSVLIGPVTSRNVPLNQQSSGDSSAFIGHQSIIIQEEVSNLPQIPPILCLLSKIPLTRILFISIYHSPFTSPPFTASSFVFPSFSTRLRSPALRKRSCAYQGTLPSSGYFSRMKRTESILLHTNAF